MPRPLTTFIGRRPVRRHRIQAHMADGQAVISYKNWPTFHMIHYPSARITAAAQEIPASHRNID